MSRKTLAAACCGLLLVVASRAVEADCITDSSGDCIGVKPPPATAKISIRSTTPAKVTMQGTGAVICETTPCDKVVPKDSDPMQFELTAKGYATALVVLGSSNKWRTKDAIQLRACPQIELVSAPKDGSVFVVGGTVVTTFPVEDMAKLQDLIAKALHQQPSKGCPLPEQDLQVDFQHPDDELEKPQRLELRFDKRSQLRGKMVPKTGTLLISSPLGGVAVSVDNEVLATLPSAGSDNIVLEIPRVKVGQHQVDLQFVDDRALSIEENERWGSFNHRVSVRVDANGVTRVEFPVHATGAPRNPVYWSADRPSLQEMCDKRSDVSSCLALGWARRWGISGPVNTDGAAAAFRRGCKLQAKDTEMTAQAQSCTAYGWMLHVGLAKPVQPDDVPEDFYVCERVGPHWSDPVAPCVRQRLSLAAQQIADPTAHIAVEPRAASRYGFVYALGTYGAKHRTAVGGGGFSKSAGRVAFEITADFGYSSFWRWDRRYRQQEWVDGVGGSVGAGVSYRPWPHWYGMLAPRAGFTTLRVDETWVTGITGGAKISAGWTWGSVARRGAFVEVGGVVEWATASLLRPTSEELLLQVLADKNLDELDRSWQKTGTIKADILFSALLAMGYAF